MKSIKQYIKDDELEFDIKDGLYLFNQCALEEIMSLSMIGLEYIMKDNFNPETETKNIKNIAAKIVLLKELMKYSDWYGINYYEFLKKFVERFIGEYDTSPSIIYKIGKTLSKGSRKNLLRAIEYAEKELTTDQEQKSKIAE